MVLETTKNGEFHGTRDFDNIGVGNNNFEGIRGYLDECISVENISSVFTNAGALVFECDKFDNKASEFDEAENNYFGGDTNANDVNERNNGNDETSIRALGINVA